MRPSRPSRLCYAVRPSRLCYAVRPSRLCYSVRLVSCVSFWFVSSMSCVYLMRLVCVMLCVSCVCACLCCSYNPPYAPLNVLNPLTPLSVSSCSSCSYQPPKLFERFDPFDPFQIFQAFDSYNYPDNSSVSIPSKCLPPRALQRVKINFFKQRGKPEGFEVFNSVGVFRMYREYGEIKGV